MNMVKVVVENENINTIEKKNVVDEKIILKKIKAQEGVVVNKNGII
jgi:hypothetical protein